MVNQTKKQQTEVVLSCFGKDFSYDLAGEDSLWSPYIGLTF